MSLIRHQPACAVLIAMFGCGVKLESGNGGPVDAAHDAQIDAPAEAPIDARPCVGGDMHMTAPGGSCFVMFMTPQPWTQATAACANMSAHLAVLNTAALDAAAEQFVGNLDTFIGLSDQVTEGTFVWADGTPLGFSNWETGEPSNGAGQYQEDCVVIAGARPIKEWDDRPCMPVPGVGGGNYAALCQF